MQKVSMKSELTAASQLFGRISTLRRLVQKIYERTAAASRDSNGEFMALALWGYFEQVKDISYAPK